MPDTKTGFSLRPISGAAMTLIGNQARIVGVPFVFPATRGIGHFAGKRIECVMMFLNELVVRPLVARVADYMHRHFEVRQHFQRTQTALFPILRIIVQSIRSPKAPGRRLTVLIDQIIVVVQDMIGHALARRPDLALLLVVGSQLIEDIPAKIVAGNLVGGSLTFPIPVFLDRGLVPFRFATERV